MQAEFKPGDLINYKEYDFPNEYILLLVVEETIFRNRYRVIVIQNMFKKSVYKYHKEGTMISWTFIKQVGLNSFYRVK